MTTEIKAEGLWRDSLIQRLRLPGSARHLAFMRIAVAVQVFLASSSLIFPLLEAVDATRNNATYVPAALGAFITRNLVTTSHVVQGLAILLALGIFTRVVAPLLLVAFLLLFEVYFNKLGYPCQWLYLWFPLLVFCFCPCNATWSLDALWSKRNGRPLCTEPSTTFRWPIEFLCAWFTYIYFAAAVAKMFPLENGLAWLEGAHIHRLMMGRFLGSPIYYLLENPPFNYAHASRKIYAALAGLGLLTELSAIFLILTRKGTCLILCAIFGMHFFLMMIGVSGFMQPALVLALAFLPTRLFDRLPGGRPNEGTS